MQARRDLNKFNHDVFNNTGNSHQEALKYCVEMYPEFLIQFCSEIHNDSELLKNRENSDLNLTETEVSKSTRLNKPDLKIEQNKFNLNKSHKFYSTLTINRLSRRNIHTNITSNYSSNLNHV